MVQLFVVTTALPDLGKASVSNRYSLLLLLILLILQILQILYLCVVRY